MAFKLVDGRDNLKGNIIIVSGGSSRQGVALTEPKCNLDHMTHPTNSFSFFRTVFCPLVNFAC